MSTCIVCGVDGSGGGWRAASVAASLARGLGLPAVLVHVTEDVGGSHASCPRDRCRAWRTSKRVQAIAREGWFPVGVRFVQRTGDAAHELLLLAEQEDAELVVVASGGSGRGSAVLVGGVASALMHRSPCPVVVVPRDGSPPADADLTRSVVCPIENTAADIRVLRFASDLASRLGGALHAVHGYEQNGTPLNAALRTGGRAIDQPHTAAERTLALALAAADVEARAHVLALLPADAVLRVAERQPGMIVVGPPATRDAGSLAGGYVALPLVVDAVSPVVVLPPRAERDPSGGRYRIPTYRG